MGKRGKAAVEVLKGMDRAAARGWRRMEEPVGWGRKVGGALAVVVVVFLLFLAVMAWVSR